MEDKYKWKNTTNFKIYYHIDLEEFILDSLAAFEQKKELIKNTFGKILNKRIKASFFVERADFVGYLKRVSGGNEPPEWATGCFYNGEIQQLLNIKNKQDFKAYSHTLTHEFVHLCFNFYTKLHISRICWFDESYAVFIDGSKDNIPLKKLKAVAEKLKELGEFDMNLIDNSSKYITKTYNAYDMFLVIGKYIFENHLQRTLLEMLKTDYKKLTS